MATSQANLNVEVRGAVSDAYREILTGPALEFLRQLSTQFETRRVHLLEQRQARQGELDRGKLPDFPKISRTAAWRSRVRSTAK
jgi:malate synthase